MGSKSNTSVGTIVVLVVLVGLLIFAIYFSVTGWNMSASDDKSQAMSTAGYVAMAFGILATLALGVGLMALSYYSSKHDRD